MDLLHLLVLVIHFGIGSKWILVLVFYILKMFDLESHFTLDPVDFDLHYLFCCRILMVLSSELMMLQWVPLIFYLEI